LTQYRLVTDRQTDRQTQTDSQTQGHSMYSASMASRGKNSAGYSAWFDLGWGLYSLCERCKLPAKSQSILLYI